MRLWINYKLVKNTAVSVFFLALTMVSAFVFQNVPTIFLITMIFVFVIYQSIQSYRSSEDNKIKLVQSYLDGRFIFKILDSLHLDPKFCDISLQMVADNILDYFLFYSVGIYKVSDKSWHQICTSGDYDPKEARFLQDFFTSRHTYSLPQILQVHSQSVGAQKYKLFVIPLISKELEGAITFRVHYDFNPSNGEVELLKRMCVIIKKLIS